MGKWLLAALALLGGAGVLWAGADSGGFIGQPPLAPAEAGRWHPHSEKMYMENWIFHAKTDDGGFFYGVMMVSNAGLYDNNPGFSVSYYAPDGSVFANELRIDNSRFHAATDGFDVQIGGARLWREGGAVRLLVQEGTVQADLTLSPTAPVWKSGSGRLMVGRGQDSWNWIMPAPRGRVSGTVVAGGKSIKLAGWGYADHCWSNRAYFSFSRNWLSLYVAGARRSINFQQVVRVKKLGGEAARSLMMVTDGAPPQEATDVEVKIVDWLGGQKYRHPRAFDITGVIDGAQVTIEARNGRYGEIIDPIGSCSRLEQKIVRLLVADPMLYRLVMDAKITVAKDGRVDEEQGRAIAAMLYFEQ
jgi:hypothetical protein